MITKLLSFSAFLALSLSPSLSWADDDIRWQSMSPAVLEKAKAEHKYVFIYGKLDSCHWCQAMNTTTFMDPAVIKELNKHYVPVKIDLDKERNLAKHYRIRSLPTLIVLDGQDRILRVFTGYLLPSSLEKQLVKFSSGAAQNT